MNYRIVLHIIGKTMLIGALLLMAPLIVSLVCVENQYIAYLIPVAIFVAIGFPLSFVKIKDRSIYAKEGFVIVALVWILLSLIGALPFVISGYIPNYVDAIFETVSGFTTTGASIIENVEIIPKSLLFWRSFTHWIGGMGVLVFVLAILPSNNEGAMHIFRAESPGPEVSKLVSKMSFTARILYGIYLVMTVILFVLLLCGGMPLFDSLANAFATAGTGGFGVKNDSFASYEVHLQIIVAVFMILFGINFNVFYLILIGQAGKAFKSEELKAFLIIIIVSTILITLNLVITASESFGPSLKDSFFQVAAIISTTGFVTRDFNLLPEFSKNVILLLMIVGACAGSTGGGVKVSRFVIIIKSAFVHLRKVIKPRTVVETKFEGEKVPSETLKNINIYFVFWCMLVIISMFVLSIDSSFGDFQTHFSSTLSCIGNIGPAFGDAVSNYAGYSPLSKIWLSLVMLAGRLEIFPMLILFFPHTWRKH